MPERRLLLRIYLLTALPALPASATGPAAAVKLKEMYRKNHDGSKSVPHPLDSSVETHGINIAFRRVLGDEKRKIMRTRSHQSVGPARALKHHNMCAPVCCHKAPHRTCALTRAGTRPPPCAHPTLPSTFTLIWLVRRGEGSSAAHPRVRHPSPFSACLACPRSPSCAASRRTGLTPPPWPARRPRWPALART